jgi:hypothetical protein
MRDRIALAFVRIYPRQWRERYANEMRDLLETTPPDWRTVIDLARGCASEWVRDSGPARLVGELLASFAAIAVVSLPSAIAAPYTRRVLPAPPWDMAFAFAIGFSFLARHLWVTWRYAFRNNLNWRGGRPLPPIRLSSRETTVWRVGLIAATVVTLAGPYFEGMSRTVGGGAYILGFPMFLLAQLDFIAHRPWFPHPAHGYVPRRPQPPARPLNL